MNLTGGVFTVLVSSRRYSLLKNSREIFEGKMAKGNRNKQNGQVCTADTDTDSAKKSFT